MKIAEFSVKNYQFTIIIFLMIIALGVSSLLTMPKAEDPVLKATFNTVVVVYPGTSPADIEKLVVNPIEDKLAELEDIKTIFSVASDGVGTITVEFLHHIDEKEKYGETVREINAIRSKLPADIFSIDVFKYTPESVNIIQCALMSETIPYADMEQKADELKTKLEKVKSLKTVEIHAFPKRKVKIALNTDRMAQLHIPLNRVIGLIQAENADIPAGAIEIGERKLNVKTSGSYGSLEEIEETIVSSSGTQISRLKDIATVTFEYEENDYLGRLNGKRAVFITATQKKKYQYFRS